MSSWPIRYLTELALLCLAGTVTSEVGARKIFTEPSLLYFAVVVMDEIGAYKIFFGASITVVGYD